MIHKRIYLGIPMGSRRNRRVLVVCYWIVVVMILAGGAAVYLRAPGIFDSPWTPGAIGIVYAIVLMFLGGGAQIGPVGDFDGDLTPPLRWTPVEAVDRLLYRMRSTAGDRLLDHCFDERDHRLRDYAHYRSYRLLRSVPILASVFVVAYCGPLDAHPLYLARRYGFWGVMLVVLFSIAFWSLPQSIILWTEPDMETGPEAATR